VAETVFALLDPRLQREVQTLGFQQPTPIQTQAIPRILNGESLLLIAPTGHGKTEAAFLPLLSRTLRDTSVASGVRLLWVTPLRALNRDILRRLVLIARRLGINVEVRHGDTQATSRRRQALHPPRMLVTTPETLQALLAAPRMREHLRDVQCVVVDEVHELASSKRGVQLTIALERLRELTRTAFQRVGLSATVGQPETIAEFMAGGTEVDIVESSAFKGMRLRVEYVPYDSDKPDSSPLEGPVNRIWELISQHHSTLVFCNERQTAEALALHLAKKLGNEFGVHHGSLSREARVEAEARFKSGAIPFLVCTSSLELGLDIGTVDLVVQFGSPRQVARLIQRVGRSGHQMNLQSKGVIVCTRFDDVCESIVVASNAFMGRLEVPPIHKVALDILAHQLVGLAIEYKSLSWDRAWEIIRRAEPYQNLEPGTVRHVGEHLEREGLIAGDKESFRARRQSYAYYFETLSVIPDIPYREVRSVATGLAVGRLDAGFADEYGQAGNIIVLRGRPWEVVKQENDQLFVTPAINTGGRIPRWSGELIPVSRETAQAVGQLWHRAAERAGAVHEFPSGVEISDEAKALIPETVEKQLADGFLPDDQTLYIEVGHEYAVLHCPFGTRINETLGRLLAAIASTQLGIELAFYADHYRILFRFERQDSQSIGAAIVDGLRSLEPDHMRRLLELALLRSPYFARRFAQVAHRFGAISKEAVLTSKQLLRLMRYFVGAPVLEEALREFFVDKLDLDGARTVLDALRLERVRLETVRPEHPSTFARQILARFGEFVEPPRPERFVLEQAKKRLESRRVKLVCLHCAQWSSVHAIQHLDELPTCPKCGSRLLAGVYPGSDALEKVLRLYRAGSELDADQSKTLRKGRENANLVLSYGKLALVVMAARGVGPTVAKRILAASKGKKDLTLYREILEAEKQFIRTREWWANEQKQ
jgi:ATP-dependent Lhr-like helicase